MASQAIHLKRGAQNVYISIDQLFEAAFGPAAREYRHKSLLGWRPLAPDSVPGALLGINRAADGRHPSPPMPPGVKIYETDEVIVLEVELPAVEQESLYLEIAGDLLIIRGNRLLPGRLYRSKLPRKAARKVHRYIQLPVHAKPGDVQARLEGHTVRVLIRKPAGLKHAK